MEQKNSLTIKSTACVLRVSRMTVYKLIRQGRIRVRRNPLLERGPVTCHPQDVASLVALRDAERP